MTQPAIQKAILFIALISLSALSPAQPFNDSARKTRSETRAKKPYKILTNGKRITLQASSNFKKILVWTATGHRIIEQGNIASNSFSFDVKVKEKVFFLLLELENGERFTEKIGL